jgi:hypothetical protein
MGELQQGKLKIKPIDLRLECNDIHATTQHVLLDSILFLSNTIPFVGMLPGRWLLLQSYKSSKDNVTRNLGHLVSPYK